MTATPAQGATRPAWHALVLACALWLALALSALAQEDTISQWQPLAERAEAALERDSTTDQALEQLRREIFAYRERFLSEQGANQNRIDTLQAQIAALGPPPEDGDPPEPEEIAVSRATLNEDLARVQAPRRAAEAAYTRADGLIREIDTTIRERQTEQVLRVGPSPLNPALWQPALGAFADSIARLRDELRDRMAGGSDAPWRQNLPLILLLLALAGVLLVRGRTTMEWLTLRLYASENGRRSPAIGFIVSLGQVIVPVAGMFALREAAYQSDLLSLRGQILAETLPVLGLIGFGAIWIGTRVFPWRDTIAAPFPVSPKRRAEGRVHAGLLGLVLCAEQLLDRLAEFDRYDDATVAVLSFPLIVIGGIVLARLGQILLQVRVTEEVQEPPEARRDQVYVTGTLKMTGRVAIAFGLAAPVLASIGYLTAAKLLLYPAILSLALLAVLAVLRLVVRDFHALITGVDSDTANEALAPVLVAFGLVIASLPLFALIWGARLTDLWEVWARFREGFAIGETRISPSDFLTFLVVFAIGFGLTRLVQGTLRTSVLPKTRLDTGGRNAIVAGLGYVGVLLAVLFAITAAGIDLSSLAIVAGALSVGIGFGLQNIVSNFVSGIILLIERPISEGDWIEVGGQMGYVRDISVRSTRIETFDRTDVIVPNADFVSGTVTNWTRGNLVGRVIVPVGVAYGSDTRAVEAILKDIAEAHPLVMLTPPPAILFMGFGADSLDFEIRALLRDVNFVLSVKSDMNHEIAARFRDGGIEIPFAQRDIWLRNPETLRPATATPAPRTPPQAAADPGLTGPDNATEIDAGKDAE